MLWFHTATKQRRTKRNVRWDQAVSAAVFTFAVCVTSHIAHAQLSGETGAHDPSSLAKDGSTYYYFATGQGIVSRSSTDRVNWVAGPSVFATPPAWTTQAVPSFTGIFWAPDIAYFNSKYYLYYSVSSWGTIDSAIGVATSPSLVSPTWTDQGKVVQSDAAWEAGPNTDTTAFNAIDPSVLVDTTGSVWMSFGSYSSGILVTQLNPSTGKRLNTSTLSATLVANNASGGGWGSSIEGSALIKHGSYYYLFVNYGSCCSGVNSTYNIRVGRSTSPTGPFLDENSVNMVNGGGTLFLADDGKMVGPGHFSLYTEGGQDYFGYHYYNGDVNGAPTYGLRNLYWTSDNWPSYAAVNPDWTGGTNANWSNAANWSVGGVPNGVGHIANFASTSSGRYTVTLDGSGRTVSSVNFQSSTSYTVGANGGNTLTLDAATGDSATINVSAGSHTIAAPINAVDRLGVNAFTGARVNLTGSVTGTGLTKYGFGTLALSGTSTFSDPVFLKWGTVEVSGSLTSSQYLSVGPAFAENATMTVQGTGHITANGDLNVGDTGNSTDAATGTLNISNSASITVSSTGGFFVGSGYFSNTKAAGTVNQTGGTLTANGNFDGAFIIGGRNSSLATGAYNLSGGIVNANTNIRVGGLGTGTVTQTGGTFNSNQYIAIGRFSGAVGTFSISGGTLNQTNTSTSLIVGEVGTGMLNISGTGSVIASGQVVVGLSGGTGTVNLNGGTLTTTQFSKGTGSGAIYFDGGTVKASASRTSFLPNTIPTTIKGGGGTIDTNGFNITVATPLLHDSSLGGTLDGGVTKGGTGTLILSAASTYTGATTVKAGILAIAGGIGASGTSLIDIQSGKATFMTTNISKTNLNVNTAALTTFEVVSGTHTVGLISGSGITQVDSGAKLTAASIVQNTLTLGSGATITIQPIAGGPSSGSDVLSVPEPSTFVLFGIGAIGFVAIARQRQRRRQFCPPGDRLARRLAAR
jgi:autotransporter-associated beta strand protein